jgi:hypothetical protein
VSRSTIHPARRCEIAFRKTVGATREGKGTENVREPKIDGSVSTWRVNRLVGVATACALPHNAGFDVLP